MGKVAPKNRPEMRLIDGAAPKKGAAATQNLRKKKKVSKKNKLAWRKHTDVADIEAFIDEKRQEERIGGAADDKANEEIFFTDREEVQPVLPVRRARKREKKPLKCESALAIMDFKPSQQPAAKAKKPRNPYVKVAAAGTPMESPVAKAAVPKSVADPWGKAASKTDEQEIFDELVRNAPVKRPKGLREKTSQLPAVEVAHPGASYNPSFNDHQAIVRAATEVEERKLRAVERTEKFFAGVPEMDHIERDRIWLQEMSVGLDKDGKQEEGSDSDSGSESDVRGDEAAPAVPKIVRPEFRKTKQQRRREAERRQEVAKQRDEKQSSLREQEVYRIRTLKKMLNKADQTLEEKQKKQAEKEAKQASRTRKLGPHRFQAPDIEVQLSDELAGSLRKLKPEGSTLQDRFASLQKRNLIEPRKKVVPHRRHKQRMFTKNAYKETMASNQLSSKRTPKKKTPAKKD